MDKETIETFLQGSDEEKYIVAIEGDYSKPRAILIKNDPERGKLIEERTYKPFLWFKHDVTTMIYGGKRGKIREAAKNFNIKMDSLFTEDDDGNIPDRLENGFKYIATTTNSYNSLITFFKEGGLDISYKSPPFYALHIESGDWYIITEEKPLKDGYVEMPVRDLFVTFTPVEQFMIQTGKRLFKGYEDYDDIHRFQFDLETEGLSPKTDAIFQIGIRDNKGTEGYLETEGDTPQEKRDSERKNIEDFFKIIDTIQPDLITGYNSENFDWDFIFQRAERLNIPITEVAITLNRASKIRRKSATVKLGADSERYEQTHMWGYNIIDISHAVRRAMAIDSDIKAWGLKYITEYSGIAKKNRVYVQGDKINSTWADKVNDYAFNDTDGTWYMITEEKPLKENYVIKPGSYIIQRYLSDDLWETEQVDGIYNQASFLIGKLLPTNFQRSSTMGTAGQWKLIMAAWSYENKLAIPMTQPKRDFTGGLARLLEVGFARNVVKLDFAALYPKIQLTHNIFPDLDISGMMKGALTYIVDTRDEFKFKAGVEKNIVGGLKERLVAEEGTLSQVELDELKGKIAHHSSLQTKHNKKQLPLKILANSWFGSYGAPYLFNWGETNSAEETTCRGRQYLRLMVRVFTEEYNFRPLVGDTDGFNFAFPDDIDNVKYTPKGDHWKTINDGGKELSGLDAVLAKFNEDHMIDRMGLDIDDICASTINFARKNYANDIGGKIKLVGNSIKSKKMPFYIEEFLQKSIRMLLDGDGHSFIQYYYEYVDKIYNYQIPLVHIASKSKVKTSVIEYKKRATKKNKAGGSLARQAYMELVMQEGIDVDLGDVLYYINVGTAKSHGDLKTETDKKTGVTKVKLNCKLIDKDVVERDIELIKDVGVLRKGLDKLERGDDGYLELKDKIEEMSEQLITDEYNVARYLENFNKKVKPLLVCFSPEIRDNILLKIVKTKNKEGKKTITTENLKERVIFTKSETELISGKPFEEKNQDTYEDLMIMEDKEFKFWTSVNMVPNCLPEDCDWEALVEDYHERVRLAKEESIRQEIIYLDETIMHLELHSLRSVTMNGVLPGVIDAFCTVGGEKGEELMSRKWDVPLGHISDILKYETQAIERDNFYRSEELTVSVDDRYEQYLDYIAERKILTGDTADMDGTSEVENTEVPEEICPEPEAFREQEEGLERKNEEPKVDTDEFDYGF